MSNSKGHIAAWIAVTTEQEREQFAAGVRRLLGQTDMRREWDLWIMRVVRDSYPRMTEDSLK